MNKLKRTTVEVAKYFKQQGCILLDEYTGALNKMKYQCSCGRISSINWNHFSQGKRCGCGSREKYDIEKVIKIFEKENCVLLTNKYINYNTPLEYLCKCGKLQYKSLGNFLKNKLCIECGIKKNSGKNHWKYQSYKNVYDYFQSQGCELITKFEEQVVSDLNLEYKCKCGRITVSKWTNFKRGDRCGYCHSRGRVKPFTLEEVKELFTKEECELLATEYKNAFVKMIFICKCGTISKVNLNKFQLGQKQCIKCSIAKRSGDKHFAWKSDREKVMYNKLFRKKCHGILYRTLEKQSKKKDGHCHDLLGYSPRQLYERFSRHPNWKEVKNKKWNVDHIFPIEAFMENNIIDVKLINCLENLRPIIAKENHSKHDTYNKDDFKYWLETKGMII